MDSYFKNDAPIIALMGKKNKRSSQSCCRNYCSMRKKPRLKYDTSVAIQCEKTARKNSYVSSKLVVTVALFGTKVHD